MVAEVTKKRRRMYSNLISILTGTQEWCEHFLTFCKNQTSYSIRVIRTEITKLNDYCS